MISDPATPDPESRSCYWPDVSAWCDYIMSQSLSVPSRKTYMSLLQSTFGAKRDMMDPLMIADLHASLPRRTRKVWRVAWRHATEALTRRGGFPEFPSVTDRSGLPSISPRERHNAKRPHIPFPPRVETAIKILLREFTPEQLAPLTWGDIEPIPEQNGIVFILRRHRLTGLGSSIKVTTDPVVLGAIRTLRAWGWGAPDGDTPPEAPLFSVRPGSFVGATLGLLRQIHGQKRRSPGDAPVVAPLEPEGAALGIPLEPVAPTATPAPVPATVLPAFFSPPFGASS